MRTVDRSLPSSVKLALTRSDRLSAADAYRESAAAAVDQLLVAQGGPVRDEAGFDALVAEVRAGFPRTATALVELVAEALGHAGAIDAALAAMLAPALDETVLDARAHLDRLLRRGWIADAGFDQLPDVVRYLRALEHRVRKARTEPARDQRHIARIQHLEREYRTVAPRDATGEVRTMLEELRVSTFAQSIGAQRGVSESKVRAALARLA
jgi:ATP-dependent helicase HrpA